MASENDKHIPEAADFHLKSENVGFTARCQDIFSSLDLLESQHTALQKVRGSSPVRKLSDDESLWKPEPTVFETETIEPRFKKPTFCKSTGAKKAQKRKDSNKWIEYDLADVSHDQLSERANTQAAYGFLDELKKSKLSDKDTEVEELGDSKLTAKKHLFCIKKVTAQSESSAKDASFDRANCGNVKLDLIGDSESDTDDSDRPDLNGLDLNRPEIGRACENTDNAGATEISVKTGSDPSEVVFKSRRSQKSNLRTRREDEDIK